MWQKTTFDDSAAGGFYNGNDIDSPAQGKNKGQARRLQNIVPVCVRQLMNFEGDEFKIFGLPTQILVIVGILKEYEVQSTRALYKIEDHTGLIEAVWWLENDGNTGLNLPDVKDGRYCRVFGSLRDHEGKKTLMILKMQEVDNINMITSHLLQVIHVRLEAEAMTKEDGVANIRKNNPGLQYANTMSFMETDNGNGVSNLGMTPVQEKVFAMLKPINTANGLSRDAILRNFPSHQHRSVNDALEFLVQEGHAYSTIDNDHFKLTDAL